MEADPSSTLVYIRYGSNDLPGNLVGIQPNWARVVLPKPTLAFDVSVPATPVVYVSRPTTAEYHDFVNIRDIMGGGRTDLADDAAYSSNTANTNVPPRKALMTWYIIRSDNNLLSVKLKADITMIFHSIFYFPKDPGLIEAYPNDDDPDEYVDEFSNNITITTSSYPVTGP